MSYSEKKFDLLRKVIDMPHGSCYLHKMLSSVDSLLMLFSEDGMLFYFLHDVMMILCMIEVVHEE